MSALRLIAIGMVLLLTSGCGQLVSERLSMSGSSAREKCTSKKMIILPFADYTYTEDVERAFQRHVNIMENVTANLIGRGFNLPVQEDLLKYLAENKIVTMGSDTTKGTNMPGYIRHAIASDSGWSADMKAELAKIAAAESGGSGDNRLNNYALDPETLAKVAGQFDADLVMRGQLLKYEFGEENTWSPLKRGIFPVVFSGTNRALFGVTNSETYDTLGSVLIGAAAGAAIGDSATSPYDATEKINPGRHNSMIWGLGGAALGYMSSKGGHANRVAVQLRLWVQDPRTGDVVWTNSAKVLVKPQSVFAETRKDELFDTAVSQAVAALTDDFVNSSKAAL
ncbi:MAG: hypothetical protein RQ753_08015 [Desulfurivibrionaceae bacterium]|nr:hypothetical protein [Desulfurivibrionaceae bacterium]